MNFGFNENIKYKGAVYHIQTEDGGRGNPVVTTILFNGGRILATRRTSYADVIKFDRLDAVVREIMREQHAAVIKELRAGLFNEDGEDGEDGHPG